MDQSTQGLLLLGGLFLLYFLPTIVAKMRGAENANPTFIINLFFGWTLLGWVIALAMGAGAKVREQPIRDGGTQRAAPVVTPQPATKKCPQCAELVQAEAKICRFCRHEFATA